MKSCISPADMRKTEQAYMADTGILSIDLMERAARELTEEILRRCGNGRTLIAACGPGGNGGDGLACARLYSLAGGRAAAVLCARPATADCAENLRRAREAGVEILAPDALESTAAPGIWVDAIYGTGLSRAPEGESARVIRRINEDKACGSRVFCVDVPSGLNGANGKAYEPCVQADVTVAFQFLKTGLVMQDGLDVCGDIAVREIGIAPRCYPLHMPMLLETEDVLQAFPPRRRNIHKGNSGHLLIVAGSTGMAGAAALCVRGALRAGAGLVTVACPESIVPILQTLAPCAMCLPLPEQNGAVAPAAALPLRRALEGKTAAAVGCGLSRRAAPEAVAAVLESGLPAVVDADALNIIACWDGLKRLLRPRHIITPHPGEAARLLGRFADEPLEAAASLTEMGCTVLLKGACTVVTASGSPVYLSASGCAGMAQGGSGDVLTGILGALLAENRGATPALTAALASELHGKAGEAAQQRLGCRSMTAEDLADALSEVFPC